MTKTENHVQLPEGVADFFSFVIPAAEPESITSILDFWIPQQIRDDSESSYHVALHSLGFLVKPGMTKTENHVQLPNMIESPFPLFSKGEVGISVITLTAALFFLQSAVDPEEFVGVPEIERKSLFSIIVFQPSLPIVVWIICHREQSPTVAHRGDIDIFPFPGAAPQGRPSTARP